MKILNQKIDLRRFYGQMKESSQRAILLDYDGTLAPFQVDPGKALPYPGVREALNSIMKVKETRVVIITGRWTRDLMPLLQLERQPEVWGSHGLERLKEDGSYEIVSMDEKALRGLVAADEWIDSIGLSSRCEKKPGCLALHWRGLGEEIHSIIRQVRPSLSLIAESWGLELKDFDGGMELRVPGRDKGDAVRTIMEELGQDSVAAYLGDDATDEEAFIAVKERGIGLLVRREFRPTSADIWIKPPEELIAFLSDWLPEREERHFFPE